MLFLLSMSCAAKVPIPTSQTVLCPIESVTNSLLQLHQIATGCLQVGKAAWFIHNDNDLSSQICMSGCFEFLGIQCVAQISISSLN